jgi:hypothetical protein
MMRPVTSRDGFHAGARIGILPNHIQTSWRDEPLPVQYLTTEDRKESKHGENEPGRIELVTVHECAYPKNHGFNKI